MKRLFILVILTVPLLMQYSCAPVTGRGEIKTEKRSVTPFKGVYVRGSFHVTVHEQPDAVPDVQVTAYQNLLELIEVKVKDSVLYIQFVPNTSMVTDRPGEVNIVLPLLENVSLSGSGELVVHPGAAHPSGALALAVSGSGSITVDSAVYSQLTVGVAGSGGVTLNGQFNSGTFEVSGSGTISADESIVAGATATVSGSGDILLNVTTTLTATVNGSGTISYKGNPVVAAQKNGSGSVVKVN